ncbi:sensor domain-containing diguanylate cyclase [Myxococcota bacterium]|nr:sensor domain-containing diguanylate cyclase [Myxococcota bacterium]MBU1536495.1 sensor domain-containing diguanylate cyclase [Myxococcota bacterium]
MHKILHSLITVTKELTLRLDIDELLKLIAKYAAIIVETERASIRMLDPTGEKLMAIARSSTSFHLNPTEGFKYGEGLMGWVVKNQLPLRTGDAEQDPRFSRRAGMKNTMGSFLGVPIIVGKNSLGVICVIHPQKNYFTELHEVAITLLAGICAPQVEVARLSRLATVDPLTGSLNRRGMESFFPKDIIPVEGEFGLICVIMADIDHFKKVNDTYGHLVGDQVLRQTATILSSVLRGGDAVIRYGGEEFLIVLAGVSIERAYAIAERARKTIEETIIHLHHTSFHTTISLGVAQMHPGESRDDLLKRVDDALYEAKNSGRNRTVIAPEGDWQ